MALDKILNLIFRIKGAKKAEQEVSKVDNRLVALGKTALKTGAILFAAKGVQSAFQALSREATGAQQVKDLTNAMVNLGGEAGFTAESLQKFRDATNDTVGSAQLLENTNTALVLGVAQTDDQMADLFDTAQRLGKALGVDTQFAVESLTTGLGRQSKLILDNLGITVDSTQAYEDFAKNIGTTAKNLDEQQKKTAFVNEAMRKAKQAVELLGPEQLTLIERNQQLSVAFEDLGLAVGEVATPAITKITIGLTNGIKAFTNFTKRITEGKNPIIENRDAFKGINTEIDNAIALYESFNKVNHLNQAEFDESRNSLIGLVEAHQLDTKQKKEAAIQAEKERLEQEEMNAILAEAESHTFGLFAMREAETKQMEKFAEVTGSTTEITKIFTDQQDLMLMGVERLGSTLAQAAIHGNNMGEAVTSSLKAIAAELLSKAATFALMNMFTGGGVGMVTAGAGVGGAGGFGGFLLRGFTGQTPSVNVNIKGGLVSQSYVKNTLVPALNNARALG